MLTYLSPRSIVGEIMPDKTDDTRLVTILLIVLGALFILPMVFMGFGVLGFVPMMGGMWHDGGMTWWMVLLGIVMQFLFLAVIVGGAFLLYRTVTDTERDSDEALEELRLAYARGELTDDEYDRRREALERDTKSR